MSPKASLGWYSIITHLSWKSFWTMIHMLNHHRRHHLQLYIPVKASYNRTKSFSGWQCCSHFSDPFRFPLTFLKRRQLHLRRKITFYSIKSHCLVRKGGATQSCSGAPLCSYYLRLPPILHLLAGQAFKYLHLHIGNHLIAS